jgi:hypothetical protein
MADQAQLAMLKQGADAWNAWRAAHAGTPADLANASFWVYLQFAREGICAILPALKRSACRP